MTGELDAYTFSGNAGDHILLRMAQSGSGISPRARIYRPDGTELCGGQGGIFFETPCALDATGTHAILIGDSGGFTGAYSVQVQRVDSPGNATLLPYGTTIATTLDFPVEMDTYTFSGASGERVFVRMARGGSFSVDPLVRIFRPDGMELCGGGGQGNTSLSEFLCTLDATGTYTVTAGDFGGDETGGYGIHLQRTNAPANATPMNFGDTLSASIAAVAELDAYTFTGTAGGQARVTMTRTSGSLGPKLRVYRPDGTELCTAQSGSTVQALCALNSTGTYSILAGDQGGVSTGNYTLSLQSN